MFEQPVIVSSSMRVALLAVLVGSAAFALALGMHGRPPREHTVALLLEAPVDTNAFYLTAWADGPVHVRVKEGAPITFTRSIRWADHCNWMAHELLVPDGPGQYEYTYEEWPVSCEPGYAPVRATPRQGRVTVIPVSDLAASRVSITPRIAVARYHRGEHEPERASCPYLAVHAFGN